LDYDIGGVIKKTIYSTVWFIFSSIGLSCKLHGVADNSSLSFKVLTNHFNKVDNDYEQLIFAGADF